nr:MAG TPA: capsid protein [Cressdnaviricota sp.]
MANTGRYRVKTVGGPNPFILAAPDNQYGSRVYRRTTTGIMPMVGSTARFGSSYYGSRGRPLSRAPGTFTRAGRRARLARANARTGGYVKIERKFFDSARALIAIPAPLDASAAEVDPVTLLCLNCPAVGDTEQNRDGRQIQMDSIYVAGAISIASQTAQAACDEGCVIKIYLYADYQTNAAQSQSEQVFTNPLGTAQGNAGLLHLLENTSRFKVLDQATVVAQPSVVAGLTGAFVQPGLNIPFSLSANLKGQIVNFVTGQTTSVIAAIADVSLHVVAFTTSTTQTPQLSYNSRLRFRG